MNGVNDVQSSSMVQQRNGLMMLSPIGRTSSMGDDERIVTILERDDDDEQEFADAASSPPTSSGSIPDRVLSEISVTIANTQSTPVSVNKQPIGNTVQGAATATINDADATISSGDSNKEN